MVKRANQVNYELSKLTGMMPHWTTGLIKVWLPTCTKGWSVKLSLIAGIKHRKVLDLTLRRSWTTWTRTSGMKYSITQRQRHGRRFEAIHQRFVHTRCERHWKLWRANIQTGRVRESERSMGRNCEVWLERDVCRSVLQVEYYRAGRDDQLRSFNHKMT